MESVEKFIEGIIHRLIHHSPSRVFFRWLTETQEGKEFMKKYQTNNSSLIFYLDYRYDR